MLRRPKGKSCDFEVPASAKGVDSFFVHYLYLHLAYSSHIPPLFSAAKSGKASKSHKPENDTKREGKQASSARKLYTHRFFSAYRSASALLRDARFKVAALAASRAPRAETRELQDCQPPKRCRSTSYVSSAPLKAISLVFSHIPMDTRPAQEGRPAPHKRADCGMKMMSRAEEKH